MSRSCAPVMGVRLRGVLVASIVMVLASRVSFARDLTFEDRVKYQEAIERVYYSHQLSATKRFEEAAPRRLLEEKVRKSLRESVALERFWKTRLTDAALQRELERIAAGTRFPDRLREIYAALGNDPFLVKECYVRPLLADRLVHDFFARDGRIHGPQRREAERLRDRLLRGEIDLAAARPDRVELQVRREAGGTGSPTRAGELRLNPDAFSRFRASSPRALHEIGALREEDDVFDIRVLLGESSDELRVASYVIRKKTWNDWWSGHEETFSDRDARVVASATVPLPVASSVHATDAPSCDGQGAWANGILDEALDEMSSPRSVWTGSEMLIWGTINDLPIGRRYDPLTDSYARISIRNAPSGTGPTAIWTGSEMIVWGGLTFDIVNGFGETNRGGRYDPLTDRWESTTTLGAPSGRSLQTAIWTGSRMIIWGGGSNTGGQYDPVNDRWSPTSLSGAPIARSQHSAVWTGSKMVVWGGATDGSDVTNTGAQYDPTLDSWAPTSVTGAPVGRALQTAVWTGSKMVVWGGYFYTPFGTDTPNELSLYDPVNDSWQIRPVTDGPTGRSGHVAVWTGSSMLIDGGYPGGWKYDPAHDSWSPISEINAPEWTTISTGVWTGSLFIVWGGGVGGRYEPTGDSWAPVASINAPIKRFGHTAVWTGNLMLVYGGLSDHGVLGDGWRYDPVSDAWSMTSSPPLEGYYAAYHTAVWTGSRMIVWGGEANYPTVLNQGFRYDPVADGWEATSTVDAPAARIDHTAVWTGREMIVWGGTLAYNLGAPVGTSSGGRYDPETDGWTSTALAGAPAPRLLQSAVWTGRVMSIWGGMDTPSYPDTTLYGDGANYDPETDSWQAIAGSDAPSPRFFHTAVWTGDRMIIWGGEGGGSANSGGIYDPVANDWAAISAVNGPIQVEEHAAVWTGRYMLVWGGLYGRPVNTGGQYDPATDRWSQISTDGAPPPMVGHAAVWTGTDMIVWGGRMGGRYRPDDSADGDGDGYRVCGGDCNDSDGRVFPGAVEACDGADQNCDGRVDEEFHVGASCSVEVDACHMTQGTLQCSADHSGSDCVGTTSFHDTAAPAISCPADTTIECPGHDSDLGQATASDACDAAPRVATSAPSVLPMGASLVDWTATDATGNSATCHQSVMVRDTTPPTVAMSVGPSFLWPPNHRLAQVHAGVTAGDACDVTSITLSSVASNEPDDAAGLSDGNTAEDVRGAQIGSADFDFELRAERDGNGTGRAYEVVYAAVDGSGNSSTARSFVFVPHDQGGVTEPLMISVDNAGNGTTLRWQAVSGALSYRAIRGSVGSLRETTEAIDLGTVICLQPSSSATTTTGHEDAEIPPLGKAFFYLAAYNDGQDSGYGTVSVTKPRVVSGGGCEANAITDPSGDPVSRSTTVPRIKRH